MAPKKTRIALVGIGRWGKNLLKEFNEQAEVVWCLYKDSEETRKFLEETYPHIQITTRLEDVLEDTGVEAVIVATPTHTHFEIAQKVLVADKHLFLEKPGCSSSKELEILCQEAEKRNLTFAVGYEFAHHPALKKIKEIISGEEIKNIHTEWFKWGTFADSAIPHLLTHELSLMQMLVGKNIIPRHCSMTKIISDTDILYSEFQGREFTGTSLINRASADKRKTVTIGTATQDILWTNNDLYTIDVSQKKLIPVPIDETSAVACEIQDFLSAITEKRKPLTDGQFALDVFKIVESIPTYQ